MNDGMNDGTNDKRRVLVLGGTGYVGSAVVRTLAAAGVSSAFTYHRAAERAHALTADTSVPNYHLDLADPDGIRAALADVCAEQGPPDAVINCAAYSDSSRLADIDDRILHRTMAVNVNGVFVAVQFLAPHLRASGGDVVLLTGPDAIGAAPSAIHFAASQMAVVGLARGLASELGPHGVRVNVLTVGVLDGGAGRLLPPERLAEVERYSALGRLGTDRETARAALWLALSNPYLNGAVIPVTGGL